MIVLVTAAVLLRADPVDTLKLSFEVMERDQTSVSSKLERLSSDLAEWANFGSNDGDAHQHLVFLHSKGGELHARLVALEQQLGRLSSSCVAADSCLNSVASFYENTANSLADPDGTQIFEDMAKNTRTEASHLDARINLVGKHRTSINALALQLENKMHLLTELIAFHNSRSAVVIESTTIQGLTLKVYALFDKTRGELAQISAIVDTPLDQQPRPSVQTRVASISSAPSLSEEQVPNASFDPQFENSNPHDPLFFFSKLPGGPPTGFRSGNDFTQGVAAR